MQERKCFVCGDFGYIAWYCKNRRDIEESRKVEVGEPECQPSSNKFEVLMSRVVQTESLEKKPDNSSISAESEEKKKKKLLRKVTVKIGLKQKDNREGIIVETLLDSEATELVMSLEFARENNFKKKKLDRLIYVRNVNGIFNHE